MKKFIAYFVSAIMVVTFSVPATAFAGGSPTGPYTHPALESCLALMGYGDAEVPTTRRAIKRLKRSCKRSYKGLNKVSRLTEAKCDRIRDRYSADVSHYRVVPRRVTLANSCFTLFPVVSRVEASLDITISSDTPESQTLNVGERDAHVATIDLRASDGDVFVNDLTLAVDRTPEAVSQVTLVDMGTGEEIGTSFPMPDTYVTFHDDFFVEADRLMKIAVYVDIAPVNDYLGEYFYIEVGSANAVSADTAETIDVDISAWGGNHMYIGLGQLIASLASDSPAAGPIVPGVSTVLAVNFHAVDADFELDDLALSFVSSSTSPTADYAKARLDGYSLGTSYFSSGEALFTGSEFVVENGTSETVYFEVFIPSLELGDAYVFSLDYEATNLISGEMVDGTPVRGNTLYR